MKLIISRFSGIWKFVFLILVLFCNSSAGYGQDISNFTQFFINPYTINPSYTGVEGQTALFLGYRKQWASINGGPAIANFSAHTPISQKMGLGFSATSDKRGITLVSAAMVSVSYTATIDNTTSFRFGLSAGVGSNTVDLSNINFPDPAINASYFKNYSLVGNAGISFHKKTFHIGVAMPNIFEPIYLSKDAFTITAAKPFESIVIHTSNRFYFNNDRNVFEPYLLYRLNGSLSTQIELAAVVHLQHSVWVGASYKQQFGISGLLGFKIKNQFAIGFSYSIQNFGENQIPSPSYEMQVGYLLGNKMKDVNLYSFVNTQKEKHNTKSLADRKKQQQILASKLAEDGKKHEAQLAKQKADQLAKTQSKPSGEIAKPIAKAVVRADTTHNGGARFKAKPSIVDGTAPQHIEEQDKLARLEVHVDNPTEEHSGEIEHPHAERHEFVKKGGHHEEMDFGDYVIAGVFRSRDHAESYSNGLNKLSFTTDFGFLTQKELWYVYVSETKDINLARASRDKYRKMKIFRDSWLLTVQK